MKGSCRPSALIAQRQNSAVQSQAATPQRRPDLVRGAAALAAPALGPCSSPSSGSNRPPQLPGGYPGRSPRSTANVSGDPQDVLASSPVSSRGNSRKSQTSVSSSSRRGSKEGHSAAGVESGVDVDSDFDEESFAAALAEFDALSSHLHTNYDVSGLGSAEQRPLTGGTVASSSSTTLPNSSCGASDVTGAGDFESRNTEAVASNAQISAVSVAQQVQKDLQHCKFPRGCRVETSPGSAVQFFFIIDVSEGPYTPTTLYFWVKVFEDFPRSGSFSVRCTDRIFHPCIDPVSKHVELPQDVTSPSTGAMRISNLLSAIREIIVSPPELPAVNGDASLLLQTDREEFRRTVRLTLNGGDYQGVVFDHVQTRKAQSQNDTKHTLEASPAIEPVSEDVRVALMELEVLRDEFTKMGLEWQKGLRELSIID